jgi:hypothetical protein
MDAKRSDAIRPEPPGDLTESKMNVFLRLKSTNAFNRNSLNTTVLSSLPRQPARISSPQRAQVNE